MGGFGSANRHFRNKWGIVMIKFVRLAALAATWAAAGVAMTVATAASAARRTNLIMTIPHLFRKWRLVEPKPPIRDAPINLAHLRLCSAIWFPAR